MSSSSLAGKVPVVTGASRGIGAAIARRLAADGAKVVVNYSTSAPAADQVVADMMAAGGEAIAAEDTPAGLGMYGASKAAVEALTSSLAYELGSRGITVNVIRPGRPEDVANAVAFLAPDDAAFITGQSIAVSGGGAL